MNTNPLVSIIIPVYGVEEYIARCARSVFEQTYQNLEIIFVDDCTPDNSIDVLKKVMEEYPERKEQVKILRHDHNRGLSAARNTGIDAAAGDYIYFLDSDDAITEDGIDTLINPLKNSTYDFVIGNIEYVDFPQLNGIPQLKAKDGPIMDNSVLESYNNSLWYCMAWNKLLNKKFVITNKLYFKEGIISEDELWSFLLSVTAKSMYVVSKPTYIYYNRKGSIMASVNVERDLESYGIIVAEARKIQQQLHLFSYNGNYKIDCFQDLPSNNLRLLGQYSKRKWYQVVRKFDVRTIKQKWMCYRAKKSLLPYNFHYFIPEPLGYLWHKWYGFWWKLL